MPVTITTRVEEPLAKDIDEIAKKELTDRSTVIRRLLAKGTKEWQIEMAMRDYEDGKITLWQAAKRCGMSLWEMIEEVKKRRVHVPYTLDDLKEDVEALSE